MKGSPQPTVLRMKRGRDEEALGDFVLTEREDSSLAGRLESVEITSQGDRVGRRRVFRLVASVTAEEAQTLLDGPDWMGALRRKRIDVKKKKTLEVADESGKRDRENQTERLKASRLRLLEERRFGSGGNVLDVEQTDLFGAGRTAKKRTREEQQVDANLASDAPETLYCNGQPMKRIELSLAASESSELVDLFLEETPAIAGWYEREEETELREIQLERFCEDDRDEDEDQRRMRWDEEDPDGVELDYPSTSSGSDSQAERDEFGFGWAKPGYDSEDVDLYGNDDEDEEHVHYDTSLYMDEELQSDKDMPWNLQLKML